VAVGMKSVVAWRFERMIDDRVDALAEVRGDLRRELPPGLPDCDVVVLVVSELVSNAVVHGDAPRRLVVVGSEGRMRIEVTDGRTDMGVVDDESRGLVVVAHLATAWGVRPSNTSGKVVWAEVAWAS
jgi:anti-sigma regulatory factor (Ser/Thr protein kinase)